MDEFDGFSMTRVFFQVICWMRPSEARHLLASTTLGWFASASSLREDFSRCHSFNICETTTQQKSMQHVGPVEQWQ